MDRKLGGEKKLSEIEFRRSCQVIQQTLSQGLVDPNLRFTEASRRLADTEYLCCGCDDRIAPGRLLIDIGAGWMTHDNAACFNRTMEYVRDALKT